MSKTSIYVPGCVFVIICMGLIIVGSCNKKDKNAGPTCNFSTDVKPIITNKCALSGCHGTGSSLGDFTDFVTFKSKVDQGFVKRNVFELKIMPPASATPLTDKEKETLKCWLDDGALQN